MDMRFVVHEHHARGLHYDLRLEHGGVLRSWAVPKGPSMNPAQKRLCVRVADHALGFLAFEGRIPAGRPGAGPVLIWDRGTYEILEETPEKISMTLHGGKLRGGFTLTRLKKGRRGDEWLLVKHRDAFALPRWETLPEWTAQRDRELETRDPPCDPSP